MSDAEMNTEELQIQIANLQKERGMSNVVCEGIEADLLKARSDSTDSSAKRKSDQQIGPSPSNHTPKMMKYLRWHCPIQVDKCYIETTGVHNFADSFCSSLVAYG
ncbi:hypothetical protein BDL97_03G128400 [Sphagnum fallax]|jgi:hypothetical protein|nr:hypothetical protein BDL97_03G128400 [Sphagnum fallax]